MARVQSATVRTALDKKRKGRTDLGPHSRTDRSYQRLLAAVETLDPHLDAALCDALYVTLWYCVGQRTIPGIPEIPGGYEWAYSTARPAPNGRLLTGKVRHAGRRRGFDRTPKVMLDR